MRTITIPAGIEKGELKLDFTDAMTEAINNFPEAGKGIANIRKANKIVDKLEAAKKDAAKTIDFDDADYDFLVKAVNELGWNPRLVSLLIPFMDALEKAEKK